MSYKAQIVRLTNIRKHPNADKLALADVAGSTVIVGLDSKEGTLGIFFPTDGQLSEAYAKANNLIRVKDPLTGKNTGGLFDENRKVCNTRIRGEKSYGYWAGLESLHFISTDTSALKEGLELDSFNGVLLCEKYLTPATRRHLEKNKNIGLPGNIKEPSKIERVFPKHYDTSNLKANFHAISQKPSLMIMTEKLHGTSGRVAYVEVEEFVPQENMTWGQRIKAWWTKKQPTRKVFKLLNGSRNLILSEKAALDPYYGDTPFRWKAIEGFQRQLRPGEAVYFEIVGYEGPNRKIMPSHTNKLENSAYDKNIVYAYGCKNGEFEVYVYRITQTLPNGRIHELPWFQVCERANELNLKVVPKIHCAYVENPKTLLEMWRNSSDASEADKETKFPSILEQFALGSSLLDSSHPKEGFCLRIENEDGIKVYKYKGWDFCYLEGILKDNPNMIDPEDVA